MDGTEPGSETPAVGSFAALREATGVRWQDLAAVAPIVVLGIVGTQGIDGEAGSRDTDALAVACAVAGTASLVFWRRFGLVVVAVVATATAVYLGRNYPGGPALLAGPLALVALGYTAPRRLAWIGAAVMAAAALLGHALGEAGADVYDLVILGWVLAAVLAGQALAARGERAEAERARLAYQQQEALVTERLRIAQDLHDSVAHAMTTINVQAGVAAHLMEQRPEQVGVALEAIRVASGSALDELGAILGFLREEGAAPRAPSAGQEQIGDLIERARADGLQVTVTGNVGALPGPIGSAAYRVVQEALTNTRRHAGAGATVDVAVRSDAVGWLEVAVRDDGGSGPAQPTSSTNGTGFGLIGMRERVESTAGHLEAGPAEPRGFQVVATWGERP